MASFHHCLKSGKKGKAAAHAAYITRSGKHRDRDDVVCTGHGNMPEWTGNDPIAFWRAGDKYERKNAAVYREHVCAVPNELTRQQQIELVQVMVQEMVGQKPYQFAVHAPTSALEGRENVHVHLMFSDRMADGIERPPEQMFKRFNAANPELGGRRKDSGGKNRLELRDRLIAMRRKCAELQNAALEQYGHSSRVDHRTLKAQGKGTEPERHLGPARVREMTPQDKEVHVAYRKLRGRRDPSCDEERALS